ncbi:MAG: hypothetical protein CM1200mP20_05610 [Pseudomonadota bacterium]|nr:MAG: hypothetical protein CM1200mP20_05610 [Pseudomonadota bacterium]
MPVLCTVRPFAREVADHLANPSLVTAKGESRRSLLWRHRSLRRFLDLYYPPCREFELPRDDDVVVCRCEEVTAGEIRQVASLGCVGPNQGKAFTRCGWDPAWEGSGRDRESADCRTPWTNDG